MIKLFLFLIFSINVHSSESMRDCAVLPVIDGADNNLAFKVFEEVENFIKESEVCNYKSNSEVINVLSQYSKNLESHLENKDVLKVISDKTKAGSLLKIKLVAGADQTEVYLEIISDNGEDRLFKEKAQVKGHDVILISQLIKNWLENFKDTIPYLGRIKGILGEQITLDIGKKSKIFTGNPIVIERMISKNKHPLLKEVVEYQSEKIGEATIYDVNENQAQAKVTKLENNKKLKIEDWVNLDRNNLNPMPVDMNSVSKNKSSFGKLGNFGVFLIGNQSSYLASGTSRKELKGTFFGGKIESELWLTRNYLIEIEYSKAFGSYKKVEGSFVSSSFTSANSLLQINLGYKYLPIDFFYGPQIDFYFGYASNVYGVNTDLTDTLTELTFSGLSLGAKGSIPILNQFRLFAKINFLIFPNFSEKVRILGISDSTSSFKFESGLTYSTDQNLSYLASFELSNNKANFLGLTKEQQFKDSQLKFGTIFTF